MSNLDNIIPIYGYDNVTGSREFVKALAIDLCSDSLTILLGSIINLWFFISIVSSRELRSKLRNQVICSVTLYQLVKLFLFLLPQDFQVVSRSFPTVPTLFTKCSFVDYMYTFSLADSIIPHYSIAILSFVFLAQVFDYDPTSNIRWTIVRMARFALLLFPWVLGFAAAPPSLVLISHSGYPCLTIDRSKIYALVIAYTFVPIVMSLVVVLTAAVFKCRRFHYQDQRLMGRDAQVDSSLTYLAAVVVCILCGAGEVARCIDFTTRSYNWSLVYRALSVALQTSQVVLLPLAWLILPDIRHRLKTWRPCRRSSQAVYLRTPRHIPMVNMAFGHPSPSHYDGYSNDLSDPSPPHLYGYHKDPNDTSPPHHDVYSKDPNDTSSPHHDGYTKGPSDPSSPHHDGYSKGPSDPSLPHHYGYSKDPSDPSPPHHYGYTKGPSDPSSPHRDGYSKGPSDPSLPHHYGYTKDPSDPSPSHHYGYTKGPSDPSSPHHDGYSKGTGDPSPPHHDGYGKDPRREYL